MAFLTLFRVATGDNWNGIMKVRGQIKNSYLASEITLGNVQLS
jgi:hypothetical protein